MGQGARLEVLGGGVGPGLGVAEERAKPSRILPPGSPAVPGALPMKMLWRGAGLAPAAAMGTGTLCSHREHGRGRAVLQQRTAELLSARWAAPETSLQTSSSGQFITAFGSYN